MTFQIYDLLPVGENNAISRRELMNLTGMRDRELRLQITAERRAGALILSSVDSVRGGYFRPEPGNAAELRRFIVSMSSRGRSTFAVLKAARAALKELERLEAGEGAAENGEKGEKCVSALL